MSIIVFFAVLLLLGSAATNNAIDGVKGFQAPMVVKRRAVAYSRKAIHCY